MRAKTALLILGLAVAVILAALSVAKLPGATAKDARLADVRRLELQVAAARTSAGGAEEEVNAAEGAVANAKVTTRKLTKQVGTQKREIEDLRKEAADLHDELAALG